MNPSVNEQTDAVATIILFGFACAGNFDAM